MEDVKRFPSSGGGPVRAKLIELLKAGSPSNIKTDSEMTIECGKDTRPGMAGYPSLISAIRFVAKEYSVVWKRVRGADAIRCLDTAGIIEAADQANDHVRKVAGDSLVKLKTIDISKAQEADRPGIVARIIQHGTIAQFSRNSTRKKIETAGIAAPVDPSKCLESFK